MEFEKPERIFLNECFVCQSAKKIIRCTGCNMIAYCGKNCKTKHWQRHKTFCKAVSQILEKKKITHIYENLANQPFPTWQSKRNKIIEDVARQLNRLPNSHELSLLKFPRVCFVCKEAKQEKLKNCPNCAVVSFCDLHPSSEIHDRHCQIMRNHCEIICQKSRKSNNLLGKMIAVNVGTKILKTGDEPPTSTRQFFDHYTKPECEVLENDAILLSEIFSVSLTIFQCLKMIYRDNLPPDLIIYISGTQKSKTLLIKQHHWETLLHLLPDIKSLKIIHNEEINFKMKSSLCMDCKSKKRQLIIEENSMPLESFVAKRNYQKPSLIAFFDMPAPPEHDQLFDRYFWSQVLEVFGKFTCPIVMTTLTEEGLARTEEDLSNSGVNFDIIYRGYNNFQTLMFVDELEDGTFVRHSQFMVVFQQRNDANNCESPENVDPAQPCFYPEICQVCQKPDAEITCKRCRIISYCSDEHRNQDQIHHKDICRVILILLTEMGTVNLFENAKTTDPDLWLRRKIDLLKKVQTKLDRNLAEYERQMFLFPKACAICHDSDSSILKSCKCGSFLCKIHYKDTNHKKLCPKLSIAYKFATNEFEPILPKGINTPQGVIENFPSTIAEFIYLHIMPSPIQLNHLEVNSELLAISSRATFPLTVRHFLSKFDSLNHNSAEVIHVIDPNTTHLMTEYMGILLLNSMQRSKSSKIIFVGPEVMNLSLPNIDLPGQIKMLRAEYHGMKYDEYCKSEKFIKPDIIFGCNLNIHEDELLAESGNNSWREIILTVEKVGVPFILTSGTKARIEKEHKTICKLLGKSVNFDFIEENPFASLLPERDFETEEVMYANKFAIAYDGDY